MEGSDAPVEPSQTPRLASTSNLSAKSCLRRSFSASNTPTTRSPSSSRLARRQSAQERIDGILETARSRTESISSHTASSRMQPLLHDDDAGSLAVLPIAEDGDEGASAADEHGGLIARQDQPATINYQTAMAVPPSELRARNPPSARGQQQLVEVNTEPTTGRGEEGDKGRWWRRTLERFQSVELENKGSVARDHLALERTFLAWLRTSLTFASIGIGITQLFRLNTSRSKDGGSTSVPHGTLQRLGKPIGATFLGVSIVILFLGYQRYFESQQWIMKGKFPASRGTVMLVSFVALALMAASLILVIAVHPT